MLSIVPATNAAHAGGDITNVAIDDSLPEMPRCAVSIDVCKSRDRPFGAQHSGRSLIHILTLPSPPTARVATTRPAEDIYAPGNNLRGGFSSKKILQGGSPGTSGKRRREAPQSQRMETGSAADTRQENLVASVTEGTPSADASNLAAALHVAAEVADGCSHDWMGHSSFSIQHGGAFAEKLQWCPSNKPFCSSHKRAEPLTSNLLLAVLGNGHVHIWAVPHSLPADHQRGQVQAGTIATSC
jgi:hypothetical protein